VVAVFPADVPAVEAVVVAVPTIKAVLQAAAAVGPALTPKRNRILGLTLRSCNAAFAGTGHHPPKTAANGLSPFSASAGMVVCLA
jgi:hypothetical protein